MKLKKYIGLAALAVAFTACQDDALESVKQQNGIYTLSAKMMGGSAMSRAQIDFGNTDKSKEVFMWNEDDAFTVYQGDGQNWSERVYTISEDYSESGNGDKKTATFTSKNPAVEGDYVALYPANLSSDVNNKDVVMMRVDTKLDFLAESDFNNIWSYYFQNNMFMVAEGRLSESGPNTVNFKHLMALARITYTNKSDAEQTIAKFGLGGSVCIASEPYFVLGGGENKLGSSGCSDNYFLITNGLSVAPGDTTDLYLLFCPADFSEQGNIDIHICHDENSNSRFVSLPTSQIAAANGGFYGFEAGKRYWFHLTEDNNGLYFSKEYSTDVVVIENAGLSLALKDVLEEEGISVELDSSTGFANIKEMDANSVTRLTIQNSNDASYSFTSLDGIENFPNLQYLTCRNTGLETCDLSKNTQLLSVDFYWNNLTELDLNSLPDLESVSVGGNSNMTTLKIDACEKLMRVDCRHNSEMTSVTIKHPENITELSYGDTQMSFDLTKFTNLVTLVAERVGLDTLALPKSSKDKISQLLVSHNNLKSIDLSEYPNLWSFGCSYNQFRTLDLSKAVNLSFLNCESNYLSTLDITNTKINDPSFTLLCGNQQVENSLELQLTEKQKKVWDDNGWGQLNENVTLVVKEKTTVTFTNKEFAKALEAVLEEGKIRFEKDSCGVMYESDVLAVTSLNFYDYEGKANITSLEGLEHFVSLEDFCCGGASVTGALKVSNNNLRRLDVSDNKLTSLDVSGLSDLDYLNCSKNASLGNNITITGTALTDLQFNHTGATSLEFIPDALKSQIVNFDCGDNNVTSMDLSAYTSVEYIHISGNGVTELVLPVTETLKVLSMSHNTSITSVDLTQYPNLVEFYNQQNNLTSINVSNCPNLSILYTNSNRMTELDLTNNPKLEHLLCGEQQDGKKLMLKLHPDLLLKWKNEWAEENTQNVYLDDTVLDVVTIKNAELTAALVAVLGADTVSIDSEYGYGLIDGNIALEIKELNFNEYEGKITSLNNGIEFFKNLTKLECRDVDLQTCDLSKNTKLTYVDVQSNQLTSLNLAGCENLEELFCQSNNNLETLVLTGCTKLRNFQAHGTALTSLNIPNPSAMDNMLLPARVGIDNWTNWETFATTFSNLTGLGLQQKTNVVLADIPIALRNQLTYLNVNHTGIETLDLSLFPNLTALDCEWNSITTLDLTKVSNLQTLHCMGNWIAVLDITGLSGLTDLKCGSQGAEGSLELTLKLTTEQMTQWTAEWKDNGCNIGVTAEEVTNAGGGIVIVE